VDSFGVDAAEPQVLLVEGESHCSSSWQASTMAGSTAARREGARLWGDGARWWRAGRSVVAGRVQGIGVEICGGGSDFADGGFGRRSGAFRALF